MERRLSGRAAKILLRSVSGRLQFVSISFFKKKNSTGRFLVIVLTMGKLFLVRPLFTKRFWTGEMSHHSKNKSTIPIQSNDAFEMSAARKGTINGSRIKKGNSVNIFSTQGRDSDEESTDRIINNGGITVNTWVGVETETTVSRQGESVNHSSLYRDGPKS